MPDAAATRKQNLKTSKVGKRKGKAKEKGKQNITKKAKNNPHAVFATSEPMVGTLAFWSGHRLCLIDPKWFGYPYFPTKQNILPVIKTEEFLETLIPRQSDRWLHPIKVN